MSPNFKLLPPLVVTPTDDRIKLTDLFANRYRSQQQIYSNNNNTSCSESVSSAPARPNTIRWNPHRQQSFELIDSNQLPHKKFRTERVNELNIPTTSLADQSSDSQKLRDDEFVK